MAGFCGMEKDSGSREGKTAAVRILCCGWGLVMLMIGYDDVWMREEGSFAVTKAINLLICSGTLIWRKCSDQKMSIKLNRLLQSWKGL